MEGLGPGLVGEGRRYGKQPVKGRASGMGRLGGRLRFWRGAGDAVQRAGFRVEWRGQDREDVTGSEGSRGLDGARGVGRVVGGVVWDEYGGWGWHFGYLNNLNNLNNINNLNNLNPARLNYLLFRSGQRI